MQNLIIAHILVARAIDLTVALGTGLKLIGN